MQTVLLVIHVILAVSMIGVILIQRSEGGGLGMGRSDAGLMTARGSANLLTRTTAILAGLFFLTSITLAILSGQGRAPKLQFDTAPAAGTPAAGAPTATPAAPGAPTAPAAGGATVPVTPAPAPAPSAPVPAAPTK